MQDFAGAIRQLIVYLDDVRKLGYDPYRNTSNLYNKNDVHEAIDEWASYHYSRNEFHSYDISWRTDYNMLFSFVNDAEPVRCDIVVDFLNWKCFKLDNSMKHRNTIDAYDRAMRGL